MKPKISTTNSKLGLIPSINLPPVITCRENCPCVKNCYAMKGRYLFKNVKERHLHNYQAYLESPTEYFNTVKDAISGGIITYSYFRWHSSGDIVDKQYFAGMVEVANALPQTSFLAFTKKFEIVNAFLDNGEIIPENLHIVFSAWGDNFHIENPYQFPVAHVRFKDESLNTQIPESAVECSGDCTNCLQCWHVKSGESVVFNKH